jgi:hypothetical protein
MTSEAFPGLQGHYDVGPIRATVPQNITLQRIAVEAADLNDLAALTAHHYRTLLAENVPPALVERLVMQFHAAWLRAVYGDDVIIPGELESVVPA